MIPNEPRLAPGEPQWRSVLNCFSPYNKYRTFNMEGFYWFMCKEWDKPRYFSVADKRLSNLDLAGLYYWDGEDGSLPYASVGTLKKEGLNRLGTLNTFSQKYVELIAVLLCILMCSILAFTLPVHVALAIYASYLTYLWTLYFTKTRKVSTTDYLRTNGWVLLVLVIIGVSAGLYR
jgi:hypothetical protein